MILNFPLLHAFPKQAGLTLLILCSFFSARTQNPDIDLLRKINNADVSSSTFRGMRFISSSTTAFCVSVPVAVLTTGFLSSDPETKRKAVYMMEGMLVSQTITFAAKHSIDRRRPFQKYPFVIQKVSAESPSFPSGHTSVAFSMATSLSIAYPKWYVIVPAMAYAGTVGYSRIYLGVHYPSDVFAGALIGAGSSYLTHRANKWLRRSKHKSLSVSW